MACVTKRRGQWVVDFRLNNKRKVRKFKTKNEAEAFKRELELRKLSSLGLASVISETTLDMAIEKYLKIVSRQKAPTTFDLEEKFFKRLFDFFGTIKVHEILLINLEEFQLSLRKSVKASSVNRYFNCYRHFFKKCRQWNFLNNDPSIELKNLKEEEVLKRVWKDEEIQKVLEVLQDWVKKPFYFLALTGLRCNEVTKLCWNDVDLLERKMIIRSSKGSGQQKLRTLPLSQEMLEVLKWQQTNSAGLRSTTSPVFPYSDGGFINAPVLSREVSRKCHKLGLKGLTLHGLRHTFITRLAEANTNLEVIRQLVGHTNLKTTQRYLHLDLDSLQKTMDEFNRKKSFRLTH